MSSNPCKICGSTDLNLVDGFYYCVECGTQDANVRETVVEQTMIGDGTYIQVATKKKFSTVLKDAVEMSGEWHKWHAYNFILAGLTEELIALGAKPTVKMVVLWIWTRYIKKFQQKDDVEITQFEKGSLNGEKISEELNNDDCVDTDEQDELDEISQYGKKKRKKKKKKPEKFRRDIQIVTKGSLLTILFVALNLDKSDIQLTHLFRFIREGRLSLYNCLKFVPKELVVKLIPNWINFVHCQNEYTPRVIRAYAMTVFKRLDLGAPLVPDLNKIICDFIKELCLPKDFKDLVLSLINLMPCDFLQLDTLSMKSLVRVPDYEGICMSYVLLALKLCFGLDCNYEIKLSDAVDKINHEEDHLKSYKLGLYSEPTDRLFSFREWYMFLQFRKIILCKYYLPMARQYNLPVDDCVFMEHLEERSKRNIRLSDDVTMDILKKIPIEDTGVIPKKEFPVTLTPMTSYVEVILEYIQDPDLKLRLCEDFSQYSLKYATTDLKLSGYNTCSENFIQGVDKTNKIINPCIIGTLTSSKGDTTMVFVRNCENKNWLKTNPPTVKHITKNKSSDKENDNGYESSIDLTPNDKDETIEEDMSSENLDEDKNCDVIQEEDEDVSIFDDDLKDMVFLEDDKKEVTELQEEEVDAFNLNCEKSINLYDSKIDIHDTFSEISTSVELCFDPHTFDKSKIIKELIQIACTKYRIPIPKEKEKKSRVPTKRKIIENNEPGQSDSKKRKVNRLPCGEAMKMTKQLIDSYYEIINNDVLWKISEHVKSVVQMVDNPEEQNDTNIVDDALNSNFLETELNNPNNADNNDLNTQENDQISLVNDSTVQSIPLNDTIADDDSNNIEDLLPKDNPKFDVRTRDIKQLYVKINEELDIRDIECANIECDPEIDKIISRKISEFEEDNRHSEEQVDKQDKSSDTSDSEDDVPLSVMLEEKLSYMAKKNKANLDYLIQNSEVKQFTYWMKHYKSRAFARSLDMNQKFNIELVENSPISFVFVIRECAAILNCTTFCLYKCLQTLEERLTCNIRS